MRGGEADLLLVTDRRTGEPRVVKLYRAGFGPKDEIMVRMRTLEPRHVVQQLEYGRCDGRAYEVMEYCEPGSLRALLTPGAPIAEVTLHEIIKQVAEALSYIHGLHGLHPALVHRDIKPDNILVRRVKPLELVLADFSFASDMGTASHVVSTRHRTIRYAAPEAEFRDVSAAMDWWSLGMTVAEAAAGRHPFGAVASDAVVGVHLGRRTPVPLQDVTDDWVRLLCQGLLCYEQRLRWGWPQVRRWLEGDRTLRPPVDVVWNPQGISRAGRPYRIQGTDCWTRTELAAALAANWEEARRRISRRTDLQQWLSDDLHDQDLLNAFLNLCDGESFRAMDESTRLSLFLPMLDPTVPPIVDGQALTQESLHERVRQAARDRVALPGVLHPACGEPLANLTNCTWLQRAYRDWRRAAEDARRADAQLRERTPDLEALTRLPEDDPRLLLILIDRAARAETVARVTPQARAQRRTSPGLTVLLPADGRSPGRLWLLEQRLDDVVAARQAEAERMRANAPLIPGAGVIARVRIRRFRAPRSLCTGEILRISWRIRNADPESVRVAVSGAMTLEPLARPGPQGAWEFVVTNPGVLLVHLSARGRRDAHGASTMDRSLREVRVRHPQPRFISCPRELRGRPGEWVALQWIVRNAARVELIRGEERLEDKRSTDIGRMDDMDIAPRALIRQGTAEIQVDWIDDLVELVASSEDREASARALCRIRPVFDDRPDLSRDLNWFGEPVLGAGPADD